MNKLLSVCLAVLLVLVARGAAAFEQTTYYHDDIFGSPVAATDAAGNVLWKESYAPYGDRTKKQDQGSNEVWFHGKPTDIESGLSYFGARYYDPVVGRFMGIDPARFDESNIHSFNKYAYGNNNPYRYRDPNGKSPVDIGFFAYDIGKLAIAIYQGGDVASALVDVGFSAAGVLIPVPLVGEGLKAARATERLASAAADAERAVYAARSTIAANRAAGEAFERQVVERLSNTQTGIVQQVTVRTSSGVRTRLDALGRDAAGTIRCTECKSSATAPLTKNQEAAFPEIQQSGAIVVGRGKSGFPGGTQLPPTTVDIIRP